jgi:hypothetical protein
VGALVRATLATCFGALAVASVGFAAATTTTFSPSLTAEAAPQPEANPSVIGLALSGVGASLQPPTSPTDKPYSPNCHPLVDPGFSGKCVVAVAPTGTVAGVVEQETAALEAKPAEGSGREPASKKGGTGKEGGTSREGGTSKSGARVQERDLVWRREGNSWALDLVYVFQSSGPASFVWADDLERDHDPKLVFVTPSDRAGFGTELDLVEGTGAVTLYRFLGQGFANVPAAGGLVTYVPGWTEQHGPEDAYDQTLIGYSNGSWRVFSEQYVSDAAALRQHRAAFWDSQAVAAV